MTTDSEQKIKPEASPLEIIEDTLVDRRWVAGLGLRPRSSHELAKDIAQALQDAGYVFAVSRVQWRR